MEQSKNVFSKIALTVITVCALSIFAILAYQTFISTTATQKLEAQLADYETELKDATTQLEEYKSTTNEQLSTYAAELADSQSRVAELEQYIDALTAETIISGPSATAEYKAWVEAQTALEPYDLYDDLSYAYEQLVEHYENGYDGTVLYDAALKLLVPSNSRSNIDTYKGTLNRYFDVSDYHTAINRFIDDLVSNKLLTDEGDDTYSWRYDTLTKKNVVSKLKVTDDVAEALLGLLRTIGWDV